MQGESAAASDFDHERSQGDGHAAPLLERLVEAAVGGFVVGLGVAAEALVVEEDAAEAVDVFIEIAIRRSDFGGEAVQGPQGGGLIEVGIDDAAHLEAAEIEAESVVGALREDGELAGALEIYRIFAQEGVHGVRLAVWEAKAVGSRGIV